MHDPQQRSSRSSSSSGSSSSSSSSTIMNIDGEMDYIRRVMNFEDIQFELSAFDLSSDGLTYEEAVRALALARLRIESVNKDEEEGLFEGFVNGMKSILAGSKGNVQGIVKEGVESVKKVARTYESGGYTNAERDAMDVLNGKIPKEEFTSNFNSRSTWSIPVDGYEVPQSKAVEGASKDEDQSDVDKIGDSNAYASTSNRSKNIGDRRRKKTKVKYVTDNINKDIWTEYFRKLRIFIQPIVNVQVGMEAIRVFLSAGIEIATKIGVWSGGSDLTPPQSLFVACCICILFRRGILTFLGTMVTIRLLRIAFIGIDDTRKSLEDSIHSRGDRSNDANVAIS